MLLASNKKHKEITKNRKNQTEKDSREEQQRPSGLTRSSALTRLYTESC
jgi:hypothetical protein